MNRMMHTDSMQIEHLPSFERPPVVETVLGVQFAPLAQLTNAHLGAFWSSLGSNWSSVQDASPIAPQFERFGEDRVWKAVGPKIRISSELGIRLQITNSAGTRMIQVQNGRFHLNWLGKGEKEYARYRNVRPEFNEAFSRFCRFLQAETLGDVRPNQWEVTYLNHIPRGTLWENPSDWPKVIRHPLGVPLLPDDLELESTSSKWRYEIHPQRGRLHVGFELGRAGEEDGPEVIALNLTARGPIDPEGEVDLDAGLNLGRAAIVRAFADMTSKEAHEYWGLRNEHA